MQADRLCSIVADLPRIGDMPDLDKAGTKAHMGDQHPKQLVLALKQTAGPLAVGIEGFHDPLRFFRRLRSIGVPQTFGRA